MPSAMTRGLLAAALAVTVAVSCEPARPAPVAREQRIAADELPALAAVVADLWHERPLGDAALPPLLLRPSDGVYVAVRGGGRRREQAWGDGGTVLDSLRAALTEARERRPKGREGIDLLELDIVDGYAPADDPLAASRAELLADRGVRGLEIVHGERRQRFSPTWMITANRDAASLARETAQQWHLDDEAMATATYRSFAATQLLVRLDDPPSAVEMFRGNVIVRADEVTREHTDALIERESQWLIDAVHEDGRMTYLVWPERSEEATPSGAGSRNNMIRQWMATVALIRVAAARDDPALFELAARNIDYNLAHYYREEGGLGLVDCRGRVKLGALALATYALVQHPDRARWATQEAAMRRTIDTLWHEDGSLDSFHGEPDGTAGFPNFYPGEALFLWADLYERERDPELLRRFMKSFAYYRAWHLEPANRNPAFVPWHTQAYVQMWRITEDPRLVDFVFEMNDWLVGLQEWDDARHPDEAGRFYSAKPWYGPPHASATGVYMEGLIHAFRLAVAVGDSARAERYRVALARGIRSLMQLQFVDEVDTFYVEQPALVRGGLRTTVFDGTIRCDNVQHGLMALLAIRETFADEDYRIAAPRG